MVTSHLRFFNFVNYGLVVLFLMSISVPTIASEEQKEDSDFGKRSIHLEWEANHAAKVYELELIRKLSNGKKEVTTIKLKDLHWDGKVEPGHYEMRVRSIDSRGVPGEWGGQQAFTVRVSSAELLPIKLSSDEKSENLILLEDFKSGKVKFSWKPKYNGSKYEVQIRSAEKQNDHKIDLTNVKPDKYDSKTTDIEIEISAGIEFDWRVKTVSDTENLEDDPGWSSRYKTIGKKLDKVTIKKAETLFIREMQWNSVPYAEKYRYQIERQEKNKWVSVEDSEVESKTKILIALSHVGGNYKLKVTAVGSKNLNSDISEMRFNLRKGDRSDKAEDEYFLRQSLEKPTEFYSIASYLITSMSYIGVRPESAQKPTYSVLGGTGRLGVGYIPRKSSYGFVGLLDLSGFNLDSRNFTFASAEAHAVWRKIFHVSQLRVSSGPFYKTLPEVLGETSNTYSVKEISYLGLHFGADYWQAISSRYGFQLNGRGYYSISGVKVPNSSAINKDLSYQIGVLGSYRLRPTMMGFMGVAYRLDKVSYPAQTGTRSSLASPGDMNSTTILGTYLNFYLEAGF